MARGNDGPVGWVLLSREAVARAEEALSPDGRGVRDEVGFLALHQGFADRFFPGTSVLHTRLRYALFVPWLMERVATRGGRDLPRRFAAAETNLAAQLRVREQTSDGVIGGSILPRAASQLPSMSYWSALRTWGILKFRDGSAPSRGEALRRIARWSGRRRQATDDEDVPLEDATGSPFVPLPDPPDGFGVAGRPLRFALRRRESSFLRRHLLTVHRSDGAPSLLARLAEAQTGFGAADPWGSEIMGLADPEDRSALRVARRSSALAGIGRAVYAALVEAAHVKDRRSESSAHRAHLDDLVGELGDDARSLDPAVLSALLPRLPESLVQVLTETRDWLAAGAGDVGGLRDVYEVAERDRKGNRARLPDTAGGRRRRAEWIPSKHPMAQRLHYRWANVRRLLGDLHTG